MSVRRWCFKQKHLGSCSWLDTPARSTERSCALIKSFSGDCRGCKTAGSTTSVSFAPALQAPVLSCLQGLLHSH